MLAGPGGSLPKADLLLDENVDILSGSNFARSYLSCNWVFLLSCPKKLRVTTPLITAGLKEKKRHPKTG